VILKIRFKSVCSLLLIFFFLYLVLIFWKFQSPISNILPSLPICSHRATLGDGKIPHTNKELSIYLQILYSEGITCVDVDISQRIFDGKVVIGHPSTVMNIDNVHQDDGPTYETLFNFLKEFPKASATLELKGVLRNDIEFANKLFNDAKSNAVLDQIAVEGQPTDFPKLKTFVSLRDRNGPEIGARCGLPSDWKFGNSLATDKAIRNVYESIKDVDMILPSSICFAERVVKDAIELWIIDHRNSNGGLHDELVQPWVYDTTESVFAVLKSSKNNRLQDVTKVISNEPLLIAKALREGLLYIRKIERNVVQY